MRSNTKIAPAKPSKNTDALSRVTVALEDLMRDDPSRCSRGVVLLNAPHASYADLLAFTGKKVLLIQAKRYLVTQLTVADVFQELYKMGHRDPRCIMARWLDDLQSFPPEVASQPGQRTAFVKRSALPQSLVTLVASDLREANFSRALAKMIEHEATANLSDKAVLTTWLATVRGKDEQPLRNVNPVTEILRKKGTRELIFVIMVYGATPQRVPSYPTDVCLLYAPVDDQTHGATRAYRRLQGYYPMFINGEHAPEFSTSIPQPLLP